MTGRDRPTLRQTTREELEMQLVQALTRCESTAVRTHLEVALKQCRTLPPTSLVECPVCGRTGLPERIQMHDCSEVVWDQ
jgi:ribosomal protein L32